MSTLPYVDGMKVIGRREEELRSEIRIVKND
jgi:hypothetical protein